MDPERRARLQTSLRALGLLLSIAGGAGMASPALAGVALGVFVLGVSLWLAHLLWRLERPRLAAAVAALGLAVGCWLTIRAAIVEAERPAKVRYS